MCYSLHHCISANCLCFHIAILQRTYRHYLCRVHTHPMYSMRENWLAANRIENENVKRTQMMERGNVDATTTGGRFCCLCKWLIFDKLRIMFAVHIKSLWSQQWSCKWWNPYIFTSRIRIHRALFQFHWYTYFHCRGRSSHLCGCHRTLRLIGRSKFNANASMSMSLSYLIWRCLV